MSEPLLWGFVVVGGVVSLALALKYGRQLLLVLGALGVTGLLAWALVTQAQATRQTATAATVAAAGQSLASAGQTFTSVALTVLATLLAVVLLGSGGVIAYLLWRLRRPAPPPANAAWHPGMPYSPPDPALAWQQQAALLTQALLLSRSPASLARPEPEAPAEADDFPWDHWGWS